MKNRLLCLSFLLIFLFSSCSFGSEQTPIENETIGTENEETVNHSTEEKTVKKLDKKSVEECQHVLVNKTLPNTIKVNDDGKRIVTNPDDVLVVVNKERNLPEKYEPSDLVIPNVPFPFSEDLPKKKMRKEAAKALEEMFQAAKTDHLQLFAQSGYRSYERQKAIFAYNARQRGEEKANQVSAHAGQSEHQTGLAMDVTSQAVGFELVTSFAETKEGKWLADHAHEFGFIIRYPKGKEHITGYQFEPWHIRYVGKNHAKVMKEKELTLEEYLSPNNDRICIN